MKKTITILLICLFPILAVSQTINVKVQSIQNFEHPLMKTDDAILLNKVTYLGAGTTNVLFVFDLKEKKFQRDIEGVVEVLPIKNIKIISDIIDIDVDYGNNTIVNYSINDNDEKVMLCRWIKDNKIRGWSGKSIEIKKEN